MDWNKKFRIESKWLVLGLIVLVLAYYGGGQAGLWQKQTLYTYIYTSTTVGWSYTRAGNTLDYSFYEHEWRDTTAGSEDRIWTSETDSTLIPLADCNEVRVIARAQNAMTAEWTIYHDRTYTGDFSASGTARQITYVTPWGEVLGGAVDVIIFCAIPPVCPECPASSEWSACENWEQSMTVWKCGAETDYECVAELETRECEMVCPECPEPTEWSFCVNGEKTRTVYVCSAETDYECVAEQETTECCLGDLDCDSTEICKKGQCVDLVCAAGYHPENHICVIGIDCVADEDCFWCGIMCGKYVPDMVCPLVIPPPNMLCKCVNGACKAVEKPRICVPGEERNRLCLDNMTLQYEVCSEDGYEWITETFVCVVPPTMLVEHGQAFGVCRDAECGIEIVCDSGYALDEETGKCEALFPIALVVIIGIIMLAVSIYVAMFLRKRI